MTKTAPLVLALLLCAGLAFSAGPTGAAEKISPELSRWLEDVSPIMTKAERAVFTKLQTNADRAKFVRFFWRARDPLPDTTENEFEKEYEERIRYADETFGRFSPKRGSQTDRGFFYVVLGKPLERTLYTTQSQVWPLELWFYKGDIEHGLPSYFYLIFYQPEGVGDFRLYSPTVEGPEKLIVPSMEMSVTRALAVGELKSVNGELASAAQSYLPSDSQAGLASFSSDMIIASVRGLQEKKFADGYARSYLSFKDYVETDYSDRYIASAFQTRLFQTGGQTFLHWSIEPEKMNFGSQGETAYASFEFVLRLEDGRGATIFERTEEIPLRLSPALFREHARQRFAFQDLLAVAPGDYRVLFLLKNKTTRDFSSFETTVSVPPAEAIERPGLSRPLLYYARTAVPEAQKGNLKAFVFGGQDYLVGARNEFPRTSTLGVFVQARRVPPVPGGAPSFRLDLIALDTGESLGPFPLTDVAPDPSDASALLVSGTVPLKDIKPGYYRAEVSLETPEGRQLTEKEDLVVLDQPYPVIPWAYGKLHGPFPGPEHLKVLASQYFLKGDYARSRELTERVLQGRDDPAARLLLAKSLYGLGLFKESLAHAAAVHERSGDRESAKVMALDQAGLKDWTSALSVLEELLTEATEIPVLNLAAECHMALSRPEAALQLLQRSLALDPNQPAARAMEEEARKRIGRR